jgi:hypothetical protein
LRAFARLYDRPPPNGGGERYSHDQNDEYSPKPICSIFSVKNWP